MDKVNLCLERIRVIRGVSGGKISYEQIRTVFVTCDLDEEQQEQVFELIQNIGIEPYSEIDMCEPMQEETMKQPKKRLISTNDIEEHYKNALDACLEALRNDENLFIQYQDEVQILKHFISEASSNSKVTPYQIVTRAVMDLSTYRVREKRKNGWICGTGSSGSRDIFVLWLSVNFKEDDISELIDCCTENETLSKKHQEMLLVLIHNTPSTVVLPRNIH